jgi:hypothetical protein
MVNTSVLMICDSIWQVFWPQDDRRKGKEYR